jgi:chitin disaccharide deacetylase
VLIINADDWGRDRANTDRILDCVSNRTVSSVSAMVYMEDSERAAAIAREHGIDAGLHLNFTTAFSAPGVPRGLAEHQRRTAAFLTRSRLNQVVFHPGLTRSFDYVVAAQRDEFHRLYGAEPQRIDGHHHMHLCANVIVAGLLPQGLLVRRNFSFQAGEKGVVNRLYRGAIDSVLGRRHKLVDFFFALAPLEPRARLDRIVSLSQQSIVELETHPVNHDEFQFLMGTGAGAGAKDLSIAQNFALPVNGLAGSSRVPQSATTVDRGQA